MMQNLQKNNIGLLLSSKSPCLVASVVEECYVFDAICCTSRF